MDVVSRSIEQMMEWISEDPRVAMIKVFQDYHLFLDMVDADSPDFCFIRLGHDAIPGLGIARMVRAMNKGSKIIFISDEANYALTAYEIGVDGYLLSPLQKEKLNKCLALDTSFNSS